MESKINNHDIKNFISRVFSAILFVNTSIIIVGFNLFRYSPNPSITSGSWSSTSILIKSGVRPLSSMNLSSRMVLILYSLILPLKDGNFLSLSALKEAEDWCEASTS